MFSYLKKIQNAPHKKRQRFLVISTFVITFIIFVVWIFLLQFEFGNSNFKSSVTGGIEPFKIIKNTFSQIYGNDNREDNTASTYYATEGDATVVTPMKENTE